MCIHNVFVFLCIDIDPVNPSISNGEFALCGNATIMVTLSSNLVPWISSVQRSETVIASEGIIIHGDTITFLRLTESDAGSYVITVTNDLITRMNSFTLTFPSESLFSWCTCLSVLAVVHSIICVLSTP